MARFIVYNSTPFSGTSHSVLRWGDAAPDDISIQAGAGEVAVAAPSNWPATPSTSGGGYSYNTATLLAAFISFPAPTPSLQDNLDFYLPKITEALRNSEWALLSDAPLTAPQVAEFVSFRTYLRGLPATITSGTVAYDLTPPPYTEF